MQLNIEEYHVIIIVSILSFVLILNILIFCCYLHQCVVKINEEERLQNEFNDFQIRQNQRDSDR